MKIRKKTRTFLAITLTSILLMVSASAYVPIGYKLIGGVYDRTYYVNPSTYTLDGVTVDYSSSITSAIRAWNSRINVTTESSVDVMFISSEEAASTVVFSIINRGQNGFFGYTYFLSSGGYFINYGDVPDCDYAYSQIVLNPYYLHESSTARYNTAGHEFGHALGLMHSDVSTALMRENISSATGIVAPTTDDIEGIRNIYE